MAFQFGEVFIIFDKQGINDVISYTLRTASVSNMLEDVDKYKICTRFEQLAADIQVGGTELQAEGKVLSLQAVTQTQMFCRRKVGGMKQVKTCWSLHEKL